MWIYKLLNLIPFADVNDSATISMPGAGDQAILDDGEQETKDIVEKDEPIEEDKEDKTTEEDEETEEDKADEESDDESEEEKDETKEDDETEEEKEAAARITSYTDIKKAYPDFFKKFPDIRAALFRDQRYGEIFGTVDDAEDAVSKAGVLDKMENDIVNNGDPSELLKIVGKESPDSLEKLAFNFLPELQKVNKDLYYEVAAYPIKQVLRSAWKDGKGKETDLGRAAAYIHNYLFNNLDIDGKVKAEGAFKPEGKSKAQEEYEQKLKDLNDREYNAFQGSVSKSYVDTMTAEITKGLNSDERITPYMKSKIVEDILTDIKNSLGNDTRYQNQMNSLWKQAQAADFDNAFKSRILNAALARARALVPATRQKIVSAALKVEKKKIEKEEKKEESNRRDFSSHRKTERKDENKKPLSDMDILRSA